jgi:hypothetical protein
VIELVKVTDLRELQLRKQNDPTVDIELGRRTDRIEEQLEK